MRPDVALILFFMGSTAVCALGWLHSWQERRKLRDRMWGMAAAQGHPLASLTDDLPMPINTASPRIDQLEAQMDVVNQHLERLSESQEFISRVLTDRLERLPDPRLRTPH